MRGSGSETKNSRTCTLLHRPARDQYELFFILFAPRRSLRVRTSRKVVSLLSIFDEQLPRARARRGARQSGAARAAGTARTAAARGRARLRGGAGGRGARCRRARRCRCFGRRTRALHAAPRRAAPPLAVRARRPRGRREGGSITRPSSPARARRPRPPLPRRRRRAARRPACPAPTPTPSRPDFTRAPPASASRALHTARQFLIKTTANPPLLIVKRDGASRAALPKRRRHSRQLARPGFSPSLAHEARGPGAFTTDAVSPNITTQTGSWHSLPSPWRVPDYCAASGPATSPRAPKIHVYERRGPPLSLRPSSRAQYHLVAA